MCIRDSYDSLRAENGQLSQLVTDALMNYVNTTLRFLEELAELRRAAS